MVSLADAKAHIRVEANDDDSVIERLIAAASDHLAAIGVDMEASPLPSSVELAQLLLIGHFYENREATGSDDIAAHDIGVDRLIAPYREHGI